MQKTKRLRPLGLANLLDETVELYKSNFALIVGISAVVNLPVILLNDVAMNIPMSHWSTLTTLLSIAVSPVLTAALVLAISERYLGEQSRVWNCCRRALRGSVYWPLLGVELLQLLILTGCAIIGLIPAVIVGLAAGFMSTGTSGSMVVMVIGYLVGGTLTAPLWARTMLAQPAVVLERQGAGAAIGRSWGLMNGSVLKSAFAIIVTYLIVFGVPIISSISLTRLTGHRLYYDVPLVTRIIQQLICLFISVVFGPLVVVTKTLLYFDLRVRKEGFDLELLAKGLEEKGAVIG